MDNYYKGFEGNPEIDIYIFSGNKKLGIKIWDGYFDEIMRAIKPIDGKWCLWQNKSTENCSEKMQS